MSYAWEMVRLRQPGKSFLKDHTFALWDRYVEWLSGEDIYANEVKDDQGITLYRPSWHTLLEYEYRVRCRMCWEMNNGKTVAEALTAARNHQRLSRSTSQCLSA